MGEERKKKLIETSFGYTWLPFSPSKNENYDSVIKEWGQWSQKFSLVWGYVDLFYKRENVLWHFK